MPNCSNRKGLRAQLTAGLTLLSSLQNNFRKSVDTIDCLVPKAARRCIRARANTLQSGKMHSEYQSSGRF